MPTDTEAPNLEPEQPDLFAPEQPDLFDAEARSEPLAESDIG
jgi:hypothetical protein